MKRALSWATVLLSVPVLLFSVSGRAFAATYNQNDIISDVVFDNTVTMDASQIDAFLNGFSGSCISTNSGFLAIDPIGYNPTDGFMYGGNTSAGKVIYDAAQAYGLNPQVLLATLQKEEGLIDGSGTYGCSTTALASAVGYGCPDGGASYNYTGVNLYTRNGTTYTSINGTCVNTSSKVGFTQQIIRAAWLFKFGEQRSEGNINWAVIKSGWDNSDDPQSCYSGPMTQGTWQVCPSGASTYYDGYTTIDSTAVHMDDGATAALYWYTPHFSGNQSFFNIFNSWFGSPYVSNQPYAWDIAGQQSYADSTYTKSFTNGIVVAPGQKAYLKVLARNFGFKSWNPSVVHLGTSYTRDRSSIFTDSSWLSPQRIGMQETSVLPGSNATFQFSVTAPSTPGTYIEHFSLVADGITWLNDPGLYFAIDVVNPAQPSNAQNTGLTAGQSINVNQYLLSPDSQSALGLQPNGDMVLYSDLKSAWTNNVNVNNAASLVMQYDGNLVEYNNSGQPLWASGTSGSGNYVKIQTDGNLVVYSQSNTALWSSNTTSVPDNLSRVNETLPTSSILYPGQYLQTADRTRSLVMQYDGNLVEYDNSTGQPLWASGTSGSGSVLAMQADGNLVIYSNTGQPLWASGTSGSGGNLTLQPDGTITLSSVGGSIVWSDMSLRPGQYLRTSDEAYTLVMQYDGNLVEYDNSTGQPLWASGTSGAVASAVMQADGNLVIYNTSGRPIWASGTSGSKPVLALQHDGNLVVYGQLGEVLWAVRK